jgi:hypothetical protein
VLATWILCAAVQSQQPPVVELQRAPEGELQPQALVDADGVVHLLTLAPDSADGELRHRISEDGGFVWKPPLVAGRGVAIEGRTRGGRMALGREGRLHVAWQGSAAAEPRASDEADPLLYTRLDDEGLAFEPPRNVASARAFPDSGCAIAADGSGAVWILWHTPGAVADERERELWLARSLDDGASFEPERSIGGDLGVCAASAPAIACDGDALYVLYRVAGERNEHGSWLLVSRDGGETFEGRVLDRWNAASCPPGGAALQPGPLGMVGVWERAGGLYLASFRGLEARGEQRKQRQVTLGGWGVRSQADLVHPTLVVASWGEMLVVSLADANWGRELHLDWSAYDAESTWLGSAPEPLEQVPDHSLATCFAREDGTFVVVY